MMALFSAFAKVKSLIAPNASGSTPSTTPTSTGSTALRQSSRTRQKVAIDGHKVRSGRVSKGKQIREQGNKRRSPSKLGKPLDEVNNPQSDHNLEGDTLVSSGDSVISTASHNNTLVNIDFGQQIHRSDRFIRYNDRKYKDWASEEIWLFNKLSKRGEEPLLRTEWQQDFLSFPDNLFSNDERLVHINNFNTIISEATNELVLLIDAGPRCRDAMLQNQRPEPPLKKAIERYRRWSIRDAKLQRRPYIDLIAITAAEPGESVQSVVNRMTKRFHSLAKQWRNFLRHPDCKETDAEQKYTRRLPTLYGFMIKYSVVAVVTYDSRSWSLPVRTLVTLNHQEDGHDVWHSLAISTVCCRARNHLLQLEKEGYIGPEIPDEDDPDA